MRRGDSAHGDLRLQPLAADADIGVRDERRKLSNGCAYGTIAKITEKTNGKSRYERCARGDRQDLLAEVHGAQVAGIAAKVLETARNDVARLAAEGVYLVYYTSCV